MQTHTLIRPCPQTPSSLIETKKSFFVFFPLKIVDFSFKWWAGWGRGQKKKMGHLLCSFEKKSSLIEFNWICHHQPWQQRQRRHLSNREQKTDTRHLRTRMHFNVPNFSSRSALWLKGATPLELEGDDDADFVDLWSLSFSLFLSLHHYSDVYFLCQQSS